MGRDRVGHVEHELKTWPEPFEEMRVGRKRHEVRRADRPFGVGDVLILREWDPHSQRYTGRMIRRRVTYLSFPGTFGLPADLCVMSVESIMPTEERT